MAVADALTPLARAYIRWAPWGFGKRALWEAVAQPLACRPRRFVARTRYGFRIAGDQQLIMPRCIYWFGTWEPPLSGWIRGALRPGDVFVDVGANVGYFTLLAARAVAPGGSVVAIEPSPSTVARLKENIARNGIGNVRIVEAAVAAEEGSVPFYRAPWNDAEDSTLPREGMEPAGELPGRPLPALLTGAELGRARAIKVDVEGGELGVLQGLRPVAGALRVDAEVAVEVHPPGLRAQGVSVGELVDLMTSAGFAARELPVEVSERFHLHPQHPDPVPLRRDDGSMRHVILSRRHP